ncbi:hypothetical protein FORC20_0905 [Salmonella enterica subsp. enterica serovar Typhimurium]|nr:hypothetical protein FORC20_0905 [Salmonella enterica subsp. enterica serovar Typhimurium]
MILDYRYPLRVPRASGDKPMVNMNLMSILGCSPRQRG